MRDKQLYRRWNQKLHIVWRIAPCVQLYHRRTIVPKSNELLDRPMQATQQGHKYPEEPDLFPPAHAIVVLPATFNTLNKWALGITDTLTVGLPCEYTGLKMPIVAFPATGEGLGAHPAFARSVRMLRRYGVCVLHKPEQASSEQDVVSEMILETLDGMMKSRRRRYE